MPTKIEVNVLTGQVNEVELTGKELDDYNFSLANPVIEPTPIPAPTKEQLMTKLLEIQSQLESL